MSRLLVPLDHQILWSTGDVILRAELDLYLKDGSGNWHREVFRVDSASDITTYPAQPNAPPGRVPRNLLGVSGVVDKIRLSFDGTPGPPHALYGYMVAEKL
jgi:hypothetical protein